VASFAYRLYPTKPSGPAFTYRSGRPRTLSLDVNSSTNHPCETIYDYATKIDYVEIEEIEKLEI